MLGIISQTQRLYRVDIAAHCTASLSELAFEGATKKNKPNLKVRSSIDPSSIYGSSDVSMSHSTMDTTMCSQPHKVF